jgi:hypothetical protein
MEPPTPSLREQGAQALREQRLDAAVDLLARAVMSDDNDVEAKALLGVAYSQKGLHAEARRALQTAVDRQPQNPNYRFNLGVVLERAGDLQGAAIAYRDTLQISPDHPQAKQRMQAMGPQAAALLASAPRPLEPPGVPGIRESGSPTPPDTLGGPLGGLGTPAAPPRPTTQPGTFAPPPAPQPGGPAPPPAAPAAPPGTVQCPRCGQYSRAGMSCEFCAAPLGPPPRVSGPAAQPPAPAYGQPQGYPQPGAFPGAGLPGAMGLPGMGLGAARPHRGALILTLGLVAFFCCPLTGIASWIMGNADLRDMDAGVMDPSGRGLTNAGRIIGIVALVLNVLLILFYMAMMMMGVMVGGVSGGGGG